MQLFYGLYRIRLASHLIQLTEGLLVDIGSQKCKAGLYRPESRRINRAVDSEAEQSSVLSSYRRREERVESRGLTDVNCPIAEYIELS